MQRKFEFTGETKQIYGIMLKRIRRISDGLLGGFIEHEANLSHEGECFVFDNAQVSGDALVADNARVSGNALIMDNVLVADNARVWGNAQVSGNVVVTGNAKVSGNALIMNNARVAGNAVVAGDAQVAQKPICITNFKHYITITETHAFIGCEHHTLEHWMQYIEQIGAKHDYTKQEIAYVRALLALSGAMLNRPVTP